MIFAITIWQLSSAISEILKTWAFWSSANAAAGPCSMFFVMSILVLLDPKHFLNSIRAFRQSLSRTKKLPEKYHPLFNIVPWQRYKVELQSTEQSAQIILLAFLSLRVVSYSFLKLCPPFRSKAPYSCIVQLLYKSSTMPTWSIRIKYERNAFQLFKVSLFWSVLGKQDTRQ